MVTLKELSVTRCEGNAVFKDTGQNPRTHACIHAAHRDHQLFCKGEDQRGSYFTESKI